MQQLRQAGRFWPGGSAVCKAGFRLLRRGAAFIIDLLLYLSLPWAYGADWLFHVLVPFAHRGVALAVSAVVAAIIYVRLVAFIGSYAYEWMGLSSSSSSSCSYLPLLSCLDTSRPLVSIHITLRPTPLSVLTALAKLLTSAIIVALFGFLLAVEHCAANPATSLLIAIIVVPTFSIVGEWLRP